MGSSHVIDWADVASEENPGNGVSKRRIPGAGADLTRVEVPAGTKAGRHSHAHEQFVQVLVGAGTIETEAGSQVFGPGSVFHFPPGTWHAAEFTAETVLVETNLAEEPAVIDR